MTPSFSKPVLTAEDKDILESLTTAYSYYKLFQLDSFVNYVVYQSKLYVVQKNFTKAMDIITCGTYSARRPSYYTVATTPFPPEGCSGRRSQTARTSWWPTTSGGMKWMVFSSVSTSGTILSLMMVTPR
jgi:hypothetical protein